MHACDGRLQNPKRAHIKVGESMRNKELKSSAERVGQLYPILVDYYGNIIDGEHRFSADRQWKKARLEHIKTEKDRLVARIVGNTLRRKVSSDEKNKLLDRLGEILLTEGIEPGKIAIEIADKTGMSYTWVAKYLPKRFKDNVRSESAGATRRVAKATSIEFKEPPEGAVAIKNYGNASFVNVMLDKQFYIELEEKAKRLEITPEKLVYNAILLILKSLGQ